MNQDLLFFIVVFFLIESFSNVDGFYLKNNWKFTFIRLLGTRNDLSLPLAAKIAAKPLKQYDPYLRQDRTVSSPSFNNENRIPSHRSTSFPQNPAYLSIQTMLSTAINGNIHDAVNLFHQLLVTTSKHFNRTAGRSGNSFSPYSLDIISCNKLIKEIGNRGNLEICEQIFQQLQQRSAIDLPHLLPNLITYSTLISRAGQWKKPQMAQHYFNLVLQDNKLQKEVDESIFNSLINAYVKVNDMKSALLSFRTMLQYNIAPSITTLNTLLDGFNRIGEIKMGYNLLQQFPKLVPDQHTYSALIHGYCLQNQLKDAETILHLMIRKGYEKCIEGYSSLIHAYGKDGQINEANRIYELMTRHGNRPNRIILTSLINACGKIDNISLAFQLYQSMLTSNDRQLSPNSVTCNSLIDISLRKGDIEKAILVLQDMKNLQIPLTAITYTTIITHAAKLTKQNEIEVLLLAMLRLERGKETQLPHNWSEKLIRSSETIGVYWLNFVFEEMKRQKIFIDRGFYNALVNGYAEAGSLEKAFEILTTMRAEGIEPDCITYTSLIKACYLSRQGIDARNKGDEIFDEMRQRTNHFTNYIAPNEVTYSTLFQLHFSDSLTIDQIALSRIYQLYQWKKQSKFANPNSRVLSNAIRIAERQNNLTAVIQFMELQRDFYQLPLLSEILSQNVTSYYLQSLDRLFQYKGNQISTVSSSSSALEETAMLLKLHERSWQILNSMLSDAVVTVSNRQKVRSYQMMKIIIEKELELFYLQRKYR